MTRLETAEELIDQVAMLFHHMPKNESTQGLWSQMCDFRRQQGPIVRLEAELESATEDAVTASVNLGKAQAENKRLRAALRDVLDLFVSPKNGREKKAEKYLRAALKEKT